MATEKWRRLKQGVYLSPDNNMLALKVRDPERFKNAFPQDKLRCVPLGNSFMVGVPYKNDTLQLLRNLNCDTRGMELLRYTYQLPLVEGEFALMPHQITTAAFFTENPRSYCTSTMRTGKTASALAAAGFLQSRGEATGCLVVATKTNLVGVWQKEIEGMFPWATVVVIHHKDPKKRKELVQRDAHFYIVNYDGIKIVKDELNRAVDTGRISVAIVDELTHYANHKSQLWQAADEVLNGTRWHVTPGRHVGDGRGGTIKMKDRRRAAPAGKPMAYVWGLTGTPGGPEMVYGQVKLVTPNNMRDSFHTWRETTMIKFGFDWQPRIGYKDKIYAVMQPCIRFDKKDIMNLPPVTNIGADASLTAEQKKIYDTLRKEMVMVTADGEKVTAAMKSALTFKLLQVGQGVLKTDTGEHKRLPMKDRIDALEETIKTATQKVVIFCAFTAVIDYVQDELVARGYTVAVVDGRVTGAKREEVFNNFQNADDPHVIICHPKTTAFGVELARADTMIFFGPPLSGEFVYQQAVERLSSLKQKAASVQIVHQSATPAERKLFSSIKRGVSINEAINDMFTEGVDSM